MLEGIEVRLNCNYFEHKKELENIAEKIIFTGPIDEYYNYCFGELEYRSVRFEIEVLDTENYQGNAVINYTEYQIPYTRIIEHKHFEFGMQSKTVISREYSDIWNREKEPYYPINDKKNNELYQKYKKLADNNKKVIFGGRLGEYKYYDMDSTIVSALEKCKRELH